MFGKKTKRIKHLENQLKESLNDYSKVLEDNRKLQNENAELKRNETLICEKIVTLREMMYKERVWITDFTSKAYIRNEKGQIVKYQK